MHIFETFHILRWPSQQSSRIALSNDSVFNDSNETRQKCISLKLFNVLTTQKSGYGKFIAQVIILGLICPVQSKIAGDIVTNATFVTVCLSALYQYCLRQSDMLIYQGQTIVFISWPKISPDYLCSWRVRTLAFWKTTAWTVSHFFSWSQWAFFYLIC